MLSEREEEIFAQMAAQARSGGVGSGVPSRLRRRLVLGVALGGASMIGMVASFESSTFVALVFVFLMGVGAYTVVRTLPSWLRLQRGQDPGGGGTGDGVMASRGVTSGLLAHWLRLRAEWEASRGSSRGNRPRDES